jgi:hypothetical protein
MIGMDFWFKTFSQDYANGVTAIAAVAALLLTAGTLFVLRRDYRAKYRPYIMPRLMVEAAQIAPGDEGYVMSVEPRNIGPHPCYVKLTSCLLKIGDEHFPTPDMQDWVLIGPGGIGILYPVGHVNQVGINNVREGRYRANRIEVSFSMHSKSIDDRDGTFKKYAFEVEVRGQNAHASFRPEWV